MLMQADTGVRILFRCFLLLMSTLPGASSSPHYGVYHNYVRRRLSGKVCQVFRNPRLPVTPAIPFRTVLSEAALGVRGA
jgi:hypothetical protein